MISWAEYKKRRHDERKAEVAANSYKWPSLEARQAYNRVTRKRYQRLLAAEYIGD